MSNPYKRAFALNTLNEIRTEKDLVLKILSENLPDFLTELIGIHGAAIVNLWAKRKIKSLFKKTMRKKDKTTGKFFRVPDKDGNWINVEVY